MPTQEASLRSAVSWALSVDGPLGRSDARFSVRQSQLRMAEAVAEAIENVQTLAVEAGTGVGKTFAYLVPVLLSGRRAMLSTATKGLQDQLFFRDLPRLLAAFQLPVRLALLKGRSSYLCVWRLDQARQALPPPDRWTLRMISRLESWSLRTRSGDLSEVEGLDERSAVLPLVTSTRDNCLGSQCPRWADCHVVKARREAMTADIVVINHHLFFADMALRQSEVAELLPSVEVAVFDEAHQLTDVGLQFLGSHVSSGQLLDLARDLLGLGLAHAKGLGPWPDLCARLERSARELRLTAGGRAAEAGITGRLPWPSHEAAAELATALAGLDREIGEVMLAIRSVAETAPDWDRLAERCLQAQQRVTAFAEPCNLRRVRWIDLSPHSVRLVETPLDIREVMEHQRQQSARAWIFTSATLGTDEQLTWFKSSVGLEDARTLKAGSPFDFAQQARLWVPHDMPLPQSAEHPRAVGDLAALCAASLSGRTFVLTTTLKALPVIAQAIRVAAGKLRCNLEVLVQGEEPRRSLLQRYGDGVDKVLVGSQSFWEGIDVPGDALQCVLIDKLPFPPPHDPLVKARVASIEGEGGRAFESYFLAEAAVSLKQGSGRLIRTESDRGLLVLCDPRLQTMAYGKFLMSALPPMTRVDTRREALEWLSRISPAARQDLDS